MVAVPLVTTSAEATGVPTTTCVVSVMLTIWYRFEPVAYTVAPLSAVAKLSHWPTFVAVSELAVPRVTVVEPTVVVTVPETVVIILAVVVVPGLAAAQVLEGTA